MSRTRVSTWFPMVVVVVFCGLLSGCADKLTCDSFSMIRVHRSTQNDVKMLIGRPDDKILDRWMYSRPKKNLTVTIIFGEDSIVSRKEWIDPDRWVAVDKPEGQDAEVHAERLLEIRRTEE